MESYRGYRERGGGGEDAWRLLVPLFPWVVAALLAAWLLSGLTYTVAPYEQAVVLRFGKYLATTPPGLHLKVPLVDNVIKVSVEERSLRLPAGPSQVPGRDRDAAAMAAQAAAASTEEETLMLTGDLNTASVEWTVQWKVGEPEQFIRRFPAREGEAIAEDLLATAARTVMNRLVGDFSFDEVIGPKREAIAIAARDDTQRILDAYGSGIAVTGLQMQRVIPPDRVKPAFDRVNASIQEKQKLENEAEATRNRLLPQARAAADRLIREAEGFAARRKAEATGEIEALLARFHAYERAPEMTRERLYLEAMQEVMQKVRDKLILDAELKQVLPFMNLGPDRAPDAGASPAPSPAAPLRGGAR
jgi:membrane protease subunit HflK